MQPHRDTHLPSSKNHRPSVAATQRYTLLKLYSSQALRHSPQSHKDTHISSSPIHRPLDTVTQRYTHFQLSNSQALGHSHTKIHLFPALQFTGPWTQSHRDTLSSFKKHRLSDSHTETHFPALKSTGPRTQSHRDTLSSS